MDRAPTNVLLEGPEGTSPEYVAPNPVTGDIAFTAYNWPGQLPGLSLLRLDPSSGAVTPVLPEPIVSLFHLEWSPDGRRLYGLRGNNGDSLFVVGLDMTTTPPTLNTLKSVPSDLVFGPTVAPDGSGLILSWTEPGGNSGVWYTERLDLANPDNASPLPINGFYPAYSPDGEWLAYTDAATQEAWLYRFADGCRRRAFSADAPRLLIRDWK